MNMSFLGKKWVVKNQEVDIDILTKLLKNRDLNTEEGRKSFFEDGLDTLHDPFLFQDMKKTVNRIKEAVIRNEKIMIFGDYDVDGVSSSVILYDFLKKIGADVFYTLPNRDKDGNGMKDYFIRQFSENGIKLIITVDTGTANYKEVVLANELGIDVIITDHHTAPSNLPPSYSMINPKLPDCQYPNKNLSGSAVVYKLVSALAPFYFNMETTEKYLYKMLGIATLGLVADCMSLVGENRVMTKYGLKSLAECDHPGVNALIKKAGIGDKKITSSTIGFYIGPRINAAGRLDSAHHAFELLLGDIEKVDTLGKLNFRRQIIVEEFVNEAKAQVETQNEVPNLLIIYSDKWKAGTLGLISGKLCDIYKRPCIAMQESDSQYVGSCRSLSDFNITGFLREHANNLFTTVGGHKMAGGFTLPKENFKEFLKVLNSAAKNINTAKFLDTVDIDCEITSNDLNLETYNKLNTLEPFGNGNPEPTLMLKNITIESVKTVGKTGDHIQFPIKIGDKRTNAIAFRFGKHIDKISFDKSYDIVFNLEVNEWRGNKKLQMRVVDLKETT